jgi:hypothetical protein
MYNPNSFARQSQIDPFWTLYVTGTDMRVKTPRGIQALKAREVREAQLEITEDGGMETEEEEKV